MISYNGFNSNFLTFKTDEKLEPNKPVKIVAGDKVAYCKSGDSICGVVVSSSDDTACVQICGYVELPYSDSSITVGFNEICSDSDGCVTKGTGERVLILRVDSSKGICGFIL